MQFTHRCYSYFIWAILACRLYSFVIHTYKIYFVHLYLYFLYELYIILILVY